MLKFSACFTSSTDKHVTYLHRTILHWRGWEWVRTVTCQPEDVLLIQHKFSNLINNKIYISYTGQLDAFSCALCGQTFECLERKTFFSWIQNLRDQPSFKVNVTTSDECDNFFLTSEGLRFKITAMLFLFVPQESWDLLLRVFGFAISRISENLRPLELGRSNTD